MSQFHWDVKYVSPHLHQVYTYEYFFILLYENTNILPATKTFFPEKTSTFLKNCNTVHVVEAYI